ncbi:Cullin repeat-like-containing domain protein, partial [Mycena maculata]
QRCRPHCTDRLLRRRNGETIGDRAVTQRPHARRMFSMAPSQFDFTPPPMRPGPRLSDSGSSKPRAQQSEWVLLILAPPYEMTDIRSEVQDLWLTKLEPGLTLMLIGEDETPHATNTLGMYVAIYNLCTSEGGMHKAKELHSHVSKLFAGYTTRIYTRTKAAPKDQTLLVDYYDTQWDKFSRGAGAIDQLFAYLNTHYVGSKRAEGPTEVETVVRVALHCWQSNVFESLSSRLESALGSRTARLDSIRTLFASETLTPATCRDMRLRQGPLALRI